MRGDWLDSGGYGLLKRVEYVTRTPPSVTSSDWPIVVTRGGVVI